MATILVADDESKIRRLICDFIRRSGHDAIEASNGKQVLNMFNSDKRIDLYILDVMIPDVDGFELCRTIRKSSSVPVIFLTARSTEYDQLTGFNVGGSDYVTKPFSPTILMKRVENLLKTSQNNGVKDSNNVISLDGLILNNESHQIIVNGSTLDLTLKEFRILNKLISNPGRVFTREQLLDDIWGYEYVGDSRNVDSHVARLRSKLGAWGTNHLKTIYGIGYKVEVN